MEVGLYTFGDMGRDPVTGKVVNAQERLANLIEEIELADQVGLDIFGLGEHHRPNYAISSPPVALAGVARSTKRIKLTSAVSVLSSDDPIRVYQQYSTLDNITGGRAELMVGRGSFIESFPLFGYDLNDYDALFEEKLQMLLAIDEREKLRWQGSEHTQAVEGLGVYPRPVNGHLPMWIAAGGTPDSMIRAGVLGLPLALAIIGQHGQGAGVAERARFRGREQPACGGHVLSGAEGGHGPDRARTRLGPADPRAIRRQHHPRGSDVRRQPGADHRQDPEPAGRSGF